MATVGMDFSVIKGYHSGICIMSHNILVILRPFTHWGRVTHICVDNLTIIGSDNGLTPVRRQAITWTNVGILLIGPLGTNFSEMLIEIHTFSFKKMHLKMSSAKWRSFCLGLKVLNKQWCFFVIAGFTFPPNEHQVISWTNDDCTLGSTMCYNKQQRSFHWKPLTFIFSQTPIMHRPFGPHTLNIHLSLKFLVIDGWCIFCEITLS